MTPDNFYFHVDFDEEEDADVVYFAEKESWKTSGFNKKNTPQMSSICTFPKYLKRLRKNMTHIYKFGMDQLPEEVENELKELGFELNRALNPAESEQIRMENNLDPHD